jgi:signal transduction histidine kinase
MHDENAFDDQDILLLKSLKEHFVTAFQKTRFINQLKDTKSQLFQSEKMAALGTLVAGVAHEINNPTSSVNTSAHNLKRDLESFRNFLKELTDDQADKDILKSFDKRFKTLFNHLDILNEGTIRIKDIVSDLKTFSRMGKEEMKPIKLVEGLQITLNLVKTQYKDFVDFSTDFKFKPEIIGNPCALNQVFMNIIINSCEAIIEKQKRRGEDKKRTLTIQTYEDKDQAVIRFKDNGIGMSEAVQQKMFDPFFTTKPVGKGMGLGLAISYNIIKAHHGRIDVKSKREKGTTITLCLPLKNKIKKNTRQKEVT